MRPLADRALGQLRRFICALHGHDALLHFEQDRMSLKCASCDYESPGWELKDRVTSSDVTEEPHVGQLPIAEGGPWWRQA